MPISRKLNPLQLSCLVGTLNAKQENDARALQNLHSTASFSTQQSFVLPISNLKDFEDFKTTFLSVIYMQFRHCIIKIPHLQKLLTTTNAWKFVRKIAISMQE